MNKNSVIPWSYSSLTSYENCPHQYYEVRVAKTTPRRSFAEAERGTDIHKMIEDHCNGVKPLAEGSLRKLVEKTLDGLDPQFFRFEHKLAVTKDLQPCDFFDTEACYHRGVLDVLWVHPENTTAAIFDWKTGKVNEFSEQLKANAVTVFAKYPHVQTIRTEYVWLKHSKTTPSKVFRDFVPKNWARFQLRVERMEQSLATGQWPKRPSGLCKKHCPVITCEHNGLKDE